MKKSKTFSKLKSAFIPETVIKTPEYELSIAFIQKNYGGECALDDNLRNILRGTVGAVTVELTPGFNLEEFEPDLSGYKIRQIPDLPDSFIYGNEKTGVQLYVTDLEDENHTLIVSTITYRASAENWDKFQCQEQWREIKPFVSNCDDVKRILKIDKCTYPTTTVKSSRFDIAIDFAGKICGKDCKTKDECWRVPQNTAISSTIKLHSSISPGSFDPEWQSYISEKVPYYPSLLKLINKEKGVELSVAGISSIAQKTEVFDDDRVYQIRYFPLPEDIKKYKCRR